MRIFPACSNNIFYLHKIKFKSLAIQSFDIIMLFPQLMDNTFFEKSLEFGTHSIFGTYLI